MSRPTPLDDATLAGLVHATADAVIICDPDGTVVYWNAAEERALRAELGELRVLGEHPADHE